MTQAQRYRAEARAWREWAYVMGDGYYPYVPPPAQVDRAMGSRWTANSGGASSREYDRDALVLYGLFLALEAEDDAREAAR